MRNHQDDEIKQELNKMLKAEWLQHYDYVVEALAKKGYPREAVKKVLDKEIAKL